MYEVRLRASEGRISAHGSGFEEARLHHAKPRTKPSFLCGDWVLLMNDYGVSP